MIPSKKTLSLSKFGRDVLLRALDHYSDVLCAVEPTDPIEKEETAEEIALLGALAADLMNLFPESQATQAGDDQ